MLTTALVLLGVAVEVTTGQFVIKPDPAGFSFGNSTLEATGPLPFPLVFGNWPALHHPFVLGEGVSTSGTQTGNDLADAAITLDGVFYDVDISSLMAEKGSGFAFVGPTFTITGAGVYQGAFTFSGSICGVAKGLSSGVLPCIVDLPELFGQGTVSLSIFEAGSLPDLRQFWTESLVYTFSEAPSEIPEPATWLLLLAGLPLARRRAESPGMGEPKRKPLPRH